jgi:hypothetical protein
MTVGMFEVGEIINPEDWGLRVQITALDPVEAVVVKNTKPTSYVGAFFPVGKRLRFIRTRSDATSWRIDDDDKGMPWYILGIYEGRKRFEHYR